MHNLNHQLCCRVPAPAPAQLPVLSCACSQTHRHRGRSARVRAAHDQPASAKRTIGGASQLTVVGDPLKTSLRPAAAVVLVQQQVAVAVEGSSSASQPEPLPLGDSTLQRNGADWQQDAPTPPRPVAAAAAVGDGAASSSVSQLPHLRERLLSGPCLVASGALVCSLISLQVKLFDQHVAPLEVTVVSSGVAWVATSLIMRAKGIDQPGTEPCPSRTSLQAASLLLLRGLLGAATVTAYYSAVEELPLPMAVALFFFHPVFALLLSSAVGGPAVSRSTVGSCVLSVLGVLVIGWHEELLTHVETAAAFLQQHLLEQQQPTAAAAVALSDAAAGSAGQAAALEQRELSVLGVAMGLLAAATNAASFVVVGLIDKRVSPLSVCRWQHMVTTHAAAAVLLLEALLPALAPAAAGAADGSASQLLVALPWLTAAAPEQAAAGAAGGVSWPLAQQLGVPLLSQHDATLLGGVVATNFAGQLLLNAGFQRMDAGRGASINTLQVLFANLWDVLLLHSAPCPAIMAGSGMIAAGVLAGRLADAGGGDSSGDSGSSSSDGGGSSSSGVDGAAGVGSSSSSRLAG